MPPITARVAWITPSTFTRGLRDVRRRCDRPPARGRNLGDQGLGRVRMRSIVHAYGGAALRQLPGRCSADATGGARHDRHLVAPLHHFPLRKGYLVGNIRCSYGVPGHMTYGLLGSALASLGYPCIMLLASAPTIITCEPVLIQLLSGVSLVA